MSSNIRFHFVYNEHRVNERDADKQKVLPGVEPYSGRSYYTQERVLDTWLSVFMNADRMLQVEGIFQRTRFGFIPVTKVFLPLQSGTRN